MFAPGFLRSTGVLTLIDRTAGTNIGDMTSNGGLAAAFDGNTNQGISACAVKQATLSSWIGKTLAAPKVFGRMIAYGSNDSGFHGLSDPAMTLNVRGKQGTAPASATDGTIIGTLSFTDTGNESAGRTIESTDPDTLWDHIFLEIVAGSGGSGANTAAELVMYEFA